MSFEEGDLIAFDRGLFYHWAVYIGKGEIVHYQKRNGDGEIIREHLNDYLRRTKIRSYEKKELGPLNGAVFSAGFSGSDVAQRALGLVGEKGYNALFKNCEHFAKWCKYGTKMSEQTENIVERAVVVTSTFLGASVGGGSVGIGASLGLTAGTAIGLVGGASIGAGVGAGVGFAVAGIHWVSTIFGRKATKGDPFK